MGKITIEQAAQRLGTSQTVIRSWIEEGLLKVERRMYGHGMPCPNSAVSPSEPLAECLTPSYIRVTVYVDENELFEVAETVGWLMLTAETWHKDGGEG